MTGQVTIVENGMSAQGLIRVHLLSADKAALAAEADRRIDAVSRESVDFLKVLAYIEAGIWNILLHWPARGELVAIKEDAAAEEAAGWMVLWGIRGEETVSLAVEKAAWIYLALTGEWPDTAWLGRRSAQYAGRTVPVGEHVVQLVAADWMAEAGVGVGIEWMEGAQDE